MMSFATTTFVCEGYSYQEAFSKHKQVDHLIVCDIKGIDEI